MIVEYAKSVEYSYAVRKLLHANPSLYTRRTTLHWSHENKCNSFRYIEKLGIASGVPRRVGFDKAEPNSQFRGKYIRNNLIRIGVSLIFRLSGTPN
jgi:hypothetical protein